MSRIIRFVAIFGRIHVLQLDKRELQGVESGLNFDERDQASCRFNPATCAAATPTDSQSSQLLAVDVVTNRISLVSELSDACLA